MPDDTKLGAAKVPIEADTTPLEKGVDKIPAMVQNKLGKALGKLGATVGKVGALAVGAGLGAVTAGVAALGKIAIDAAPLEGIRDAFAGITGNAEEMLATLKKGSLGMVTDVDLMKSYNQAAQLVGKQFADQLPGAMQYLSKVSAATGQDMGFMMDSLVKGVGRLSPMILDNLGIQVNLTEANETYAKSVGKSAKELTKSEQQTAMMNLVMEKLAKNTAAMPEVAGSATQSWRSMQVVMLNFKDKLGMKLAPALSRVGQTITEALTSPKAEKFLTNTADKLAKLAQMGADFIANFSGGEVFDVLQEGLMGLGFSEEFSTAVARIAGDLQDKWIPAIKEILSGDLSGGVEKIFGSEVAQTVTDIIDKFTSFTDFVGANLVPILAGLGGVILTIVVPSFIAWAASAWAATAPLLPIIGIALAVGAAIALVAAAWQNDWGGIRTWLTGFWEGTLKPIFTTLVEWFQVNIPLAIQAVAGFWTGTLLPAFQVVGDWVTGTLLPIFTQIWDWLATNIPAAISTVSGFWTNTLLPAIQGVWAFINDTLLPVFNSIANVCEAVLSKALEALAGLWENVLLPAIQKVGSWLEDTFGPVLDKTKEGFQLLGDIVETAFTAALEKLSSWVTDTLQPALETLSGWLDEKLTPAFQTAETAVREGVGAAMEWLSSTIIVPLKDALGGLGEKISKVTDWFNDLAEKIRNLQLPSWLTPGSPTPLEIAMGGLADSLWPVVDAFMDLARSISGPQAKAMKDVGSAFKDMAKGLDKLVSSLIELSTVQPPVGSGTLQIFDQWLAQFLIVAETAMTRIEGVIAAFGYNRIHKLKLTARRLKEIIEAVMVDLSAIQERTLPNLDVWFGQWADVFGRAVGVVNTIQMKYGGNLLKRLAELAEMIIGITQIVGAIDFERIVPRDGLTLDVVSLYFEQMAMVLDVVVGWLGGIGNATRNLYAEVAKTVADVSSIVGLTADLDSLKPSSSPTFAADLETFITQLAFTVDRLTSWMGDLIAKGLSEALTKAAELAGKVTQLFTLLGPDLTGYVPLDDAGFEDKLKARLYQLQIASGNLYLWMNSIIERDLAAAMEACGRLAEAVAKIFVLLGADLTGYIPLDDAGFEDKLKARIRQLQIASGNLYLWMTSIIDRGLEPALEAAARVAEIVTRLFSVLGVSLEVSMPGVGFELRVKEFLDALSKAAPLLRTGLEAIASQWDSLEAMDVTATIGEKLTKVFGILNLSKTFEELQVIKPLAKGERRTALSNVITNFLTQLKAAAPMLATGLTEVEGLFGGAMDRVEVIAEKIASIFGKISEAIKAGVEATTQEDWSLPTLLTLINQLGTAMSAVGALQVPALAPGGSAPPSATAELLPGQPGGTGSGELYGVIHDAVVEGLKDSVLRIELAVKQGDVDRRAFSMRMGRMERLLATMTTKMEAAGG